MSSLTNSRAYIKVGVHENMKNSYLYNHVSQQTIVARAHSPASSPSRQDADHGVATGLRANDRAEGALPANFWP